MYLSLFSIPIITINAAFCIAVTWHAIIARHNPRLVHSIKDAILLSVSYGISAFFTPVILKWGGTTGPGEDFLFIIGTIFFSLVLAILFLIVGRNFVICKYHPEQRISCDYEAFLEGLVGRVESVARDNSRKVLHVVISVAPIIIYNICFSLDALFKSQGIMQEFGVSGLVAGRGVNLLVYWGFSYMATMEDMYRLHAFHCIPRWGRRWLGASLERKEWHTFTAAVPFLLGHIPFLLAPLPVFFTISFMASLGDAAGSVFGKRFGKHAIRKSGKKTYEGLLAGVFVTFFCGIILNTVIFTRNIMGGLLYSLIVANVFGFLDACNYKIDDNFINTFVIGTIAWLIYPFFA
nr:hypothetical protein [Candidatus Sigynarchaeota archaeon]